MKYILTWVGHGRYRHLKPKSISEAQAKRYEEKEVRIYHSKEEAEEQLR